MSKEARRSSPSTRRASRSRRRSILAAAKEAGLKQIDYLVVSHYDIDHVGDVAAILAAMPVKHLIDNGPPQTTGKGIEGRYKTYAAVYDKIDHAVVKPGDKIPIKGMDVSVVAAATKLVSNGAGATNPLCATTAAPEEITGDLEDNMSIGLLFTAGKFRMLDLSDLEGAYSYKLMCPRNPIGPVDVYHVNVHGQAKGMTPVLAQALGARVAIMENGARKGGDPPAFPMLRAAPGMEDIWQVHSSMAAGKDGNPPEDFIANLDPQCQGKWLRLTARQDGSFTITNSRNGFSKTYKARN
ncbi:MAG: MBL fold metallo-hydrolase [Acidobacteriia bacterium]|nr:MBL fold metallo-hydrolase [Terriglobia bacterium]